MKNQISDILGYVYLIKSPLGYKIGKTKSIKDRAKIFEVKMPFEWHIEYKLFTPYYHKLESALHELFKKKRINGEWFDLCDEDLCILKSECQNWREIMQGSVKLEKGKTFDVSGAENCIVIWPNIEKDLKEYVIRLMPDGSIEVKSAYLQDLTIDSKNGIIRIFHP